MEKRIVRIEPKENSLRTVVWCPTYLCNYHCSYCSQIYNKNKFNKETNETIRQQAIRLHDYLKDNNIGLYRLSLFGGEISLFDMEYILQPLIDTKLYQINLTTNFSQDNNKYLNLYHYLKSNDIELKITASYHDEHVSQENFISKIESLINMDKSIKSCITVECVVNDSIFDKVEKMRELCKENEINCSVDLDRTKNANLINSIKLLKSNCKSRIHKVTYDDNSTDILSKSEILAHFGTPSLEKPKICFNNGYRIMFRENTFSVNCSTYPINKKAHLCNEKCAICGLIDLKIL